MIGPRASYLVGRLKRSRADLRLRPAWCVVVNNELKETKT